MIAARLGTPAAAVLLLAFAVTPASAQAPQVRKGSWEIAAGAAWAAGADLGEATATLERPGGGDFALFRTETSLEPIVGAALAVAFFATNRLAIEAGFSYARPTVSTRVSADAEGADAATARIGLQRYVIEGSARWYPARAFGKVRPFVRGGAGYVRELDEHSAHVEPGRAAHLGAGVDRAFVERAAGRVRRAGVRVDARLTGRSGGIAIGDGWRVGGSASALVFVGF